MFPFCRCGGRSIVFHLTAPCYFVLGCEFRDFQEKTVGGAPVVVTIPLKPDRKVGLAFAEAPHGL